MVIRSSLENHMRIKYNNRIPSYQHIIILRHNKFKKKIKKCRRTSTAFIMIVMELMHDC